MMQAARVLLVAVMVACCASSTRAAVSPAVTALDAASKDAQVVVVIPQAGDASRKLAGWLSAAGIEASEEMQDLLGSTKREVGVDAGLNDNGPLVVVVSNLAKMQADAAAKPDVVLLVSVSDYAAFVGNFGGNADGVSELKLKDGSTGFAKKSGDFAVLADDKALVEAYTPAAAGGALAAKLGPAGATALDRCDVAVYIDCAAIGDTFKSLMETGLSAVEQAEAGGMTALPPGLAEMYGSAVQFVIDNTDAMIIGLDISDAGIGVSKAMHMKKGSELAAYFPGGKANAAAELSRLPKQPYIMAGSFDGKAIATAKLAELIAGAQPQPGSAEMLALAQGAKAGAFAFYAPDQTAMMTGSFNNSLSIITADDGAQYLKLLQAYVSSLDGQKKPVLPDSPDGPAVTYSATYSAGALNIGGVSVDQFLVQQQIPPEVLANMGPAAGFVGAFGTTRGFAAAKGNYVVITSSPDTQIITTALAAAEAGDGLGADAAITDMRKSNLPANPAAEMYVSLGGIAAMVNPITMMFGAPPIDVPADTPPIAMAVSVEGDTVVGRMYVPTADVKIMIDAYNSLQGLMQPMAEPMTPTQPGGPAPY